MALTDYTTANSVRAVLGISSLELDDAVLQDPTYAFQLDEALLELHADLATDYTTAKSASPQTKLQTRFTGMVETYAAYQVAGQALGRAAMFAPKAVKDARSELQRVEDPFSMLREDVRAMLAVLRAKLLGVYAEINPVAPAPVAAQRRDLGAVALGTDPVIG